MTLRSQSADDVRRMQTVEVSNLRDEVHRNRSEGDHLAVSVQKVLEFRQARAEQTAREIYASRSLFDSRFMPASPSGLEAENFRVCLVWLVRVVQHYFVFLQLGIVTALVWANVDYEGYTSLWGSGESAHAFSFHFFVNDIFMALFFGVAMVHVTTALLPDGALYPLNRALSPLLGTLGGVVGPACLYLFLVAVEGEFNSQYQGWAACIATDISVAWLLAVQVFGGPHPAVQFLLLLAVVDDVVGLVVIAICFPTGAMQPVWILMVAGSIATSLVLRLVLKIQTWYPYIFISGPLAWYGLYEFGVHPALALCLVVPFIPGRANLEKFDHDCSLVVHVGLFFFALCNAGVVLTQIGLPTLNVGLSLVAGKTVGIFAFTFFGIKCLRLQLPVGMHTVHLALLAHISGVGLTVSLFVIELAFTDPVLRDEAKLGALLSVVVAPSAIALGHILKFQTPEPKLEEGHS